MSVRSPQPTLKKRPLEQKDMEHGQSPKRHESEMSTDDAHASATNSNASIVIKMMLPNAFVGAVIGKAGANIRKIREETPARVQIADSIPGQLERLVTVSGPVTAVHLAFSFMFQKVQEGLATDSHSLFNSDANNMEMSIRLLIPNNQIGAVIGKGGVHIKEVRDSTGGKIHIPKEDPLRPSAMERQVEVVGTLTQVLQALSMISLKLAQHPPRFAASPSASVSLPHPLAASGMVAVPPSNFLGAPLFAPGLMSSMVPGLSGAVVGSVVQNINVPNDVIGRVIGKNGHIVTQIRQLSGSKIEISPTVAGATERQIILTGTAESNNIASYLVNARMQQVSLKEALELLNSQIAGMSAHLAHQNAAAYQQLQAFGQPYQPPMRPMKR
eukprot:GILK01003611.1.p1 GENE.GILK01003611.1~~GILK01003611.1.p1  ORF type:complete len:385 (-),score=55.71 GILK01003611.1:235-1389(-)